MPLPSILNGAKQCQVLTKRTRQQCKNPAAYGCASCRMHGAHKSRNVLQGADHPWYRHGGRTKEVESELKESSKILLTLRDIGDYLSMFNGPYVRGRKPKGYIKYNMNDPEQLAQAILVTARKLTG